MRVEETNTNVHPLTAKDQQYIERAQTMECDDAGIIRYYEQAVKMAVHEAVLTAIELRMRNDFPKAARKVFGAKGEQVEELLARVQAAVLTQFDLTANFLGNHTKVGGDERSTREAYLYRYLSYRASKEQYGAQIALIQSDAAAELRVMVRYYRVHAGTANFENVEWFAAHDLGAAQQAYLALLDQLAVPRLARAA